MTKQSSLCIYPVMNMFNQFLGQYTMASLLRQQGLTSKAVLTSSIGHALWNSQGISLILSSTRPSGWITITLLRI